MAQIDSVSMTPTAVTLVSDTSSVVAGASQSIDPPVSHYRQIDFNFDAPIFGGLIGLTGVSLLLLVLPLLVLGAIIWLIVRAFRRPVPPPRLTSETKAAYIHTRQNQAIRLAATGAGIALLGLVVGGNLLTGAGLLVACIGGGNYWIARRDSNYYERGNKTNDKNPCDNTKNCSDDSSTKES